DGGGGGCLLQTSALRLEVSLEDKNKVILLSSLTEHRDLFFFSSPPTSPPLFQLSHRCSAHSSLRTWAHSHTHTHTYTHTHTNPPHPTPHTHTHTHLRSNI